MWREVWSEDVSKIYAGILSMFHSFLPGVFFGNVKSDLLSLAEETEPRFGRPPKYNPYTEMKKVKKYV